MEYNSTKNLITKRATQQGQFDLHRIERQQLIEEMWEVQFIVMEMTQFIEIGFKWLGQISNGKKSGTQ